MLPDGLQLSKSSKRTIGWADQAPFHATTSNSLLTLCLLSRERTPAYIPWGRQFFGLGRHIASMRYFPLKAVLQEIFSHFDLVKGL